VEPLNALIVENMRSLLDDATERQMPLPVAALPSAPPGS
jgi:hypothetical protein